MPLKAALSPVVFTELQLDVIGEVIALLREEWEAKIDALRAQYVAECDRLLAKADAADERIELLEARLLRVLAAADKQPLADVVH